MLSIGEIAHGTGVSRRMLRHWEQEELLTPAVIDPISGYRRYQDSQLGRVRAIAELRDLGFSLSEIRVLLDPQIEQTTLESILTHRAATLRHQITEAATRLVDVQHRLDTIQHKTQEIAMNLSFGPLPPLTLRGSSATVLDETEIGHSVAELRQHLSPTDGDVVLLFDGTRDDQIIVSAGTHADPDHPATGTIAAAAVPEGVIVRFDTPPASVADAWVLIDAQLEKRSLSSGGVYRQIISPDGATTLQAPVLTGIRGAGRRP